MYKIISMERQGNSVFKNEYNTETLKDAKEIYEKERNKENIVDVRLWYCTEMERFTREKN